ncbi:HEAT repeat domain-containing protein [Cellulomonas sp. HD19AZ1]|uniref:HEAT repeat domain-containing protein n=1 Tax=Cellulomonas sp. HD19AZ1 TaxID=2559593 RepID=UPI00107109E3|nr:HEAT repeat domain-containing protein [Cellulomonas sp. HD19AZ1]TFH70401.1 HEAT repeat domain-containing protein [Cellulomonas sp. HD19AZ1]
MDAWTERVAAACAAGEAAVTELLTTHSGLPGPRANLALLAAFGDVAPADLVVLLADADDEYLRSCGTAALGRLLLEHARAASPRAADAGAWRATLDARACDASWRVREAAAMAGQRLGAGEPAALVALADAWLRTGDPLPARAAVAALCEPALLRVPALRVAALDACARATDLLRAVPAAHRRDADVRTLRQALGYAWSVAVAGDPDAGLPAFVVLARDPDADVAWVVRENRKKKRLAALLA